MKIKDTVMAAVDETRFTRVVGMMREATTVQMNMVRQIIMKQVSAALQEGTELPEVG